MKRDLIGLCGAAWLSLFNVANAGDLDRLKALNFTDRNTRDIQKMVVDRDTCSELVRAAIVARAASVQTSSAEEISGVRVIDGCRTVSLNQDGKLQVVATTDLEDGNGPLSYVAVFKRSGLLDVADMAIGEGNGNWGPVSLSLKDINHDGRLEIIVVERHVDIHGHIGAHADPAPTVTNIYTWRNNAFILANVQFRDYYADTVLPNLQQKLSQAQSSASGSSTKQKELDALQNSIALTTKLLAEGHY